MTALQRTPGRHVTRRLEDPAGRLMGLLTRNPAGELAQQLTQAHWEAVREYGSNSGGFHAFDPTTGTTAGVHEPGSAFPAGTVVSSLAWGRISPEVAQRLLETDGVL